MDRRGVTLTELLVAIIIIAILSVVIATSMTRATEGATRAQLLDYADKVTTALKSARALQPTDNTGVPDLDTPMAGWNPNNAPDPTFWEKYLELGDVQKVLDNRAQFGFIAGPPGTWGAPWDAHPGPAATDFVPPKGTVMPEKIFLIDDPFFVNFANSATHHKYAGQVPYHPP